jgi:signal transduction histidine kinase
MNFGGLQVNEQTVLIISDHAQFSRDLVGRWQMERGVPVFTLMSSDVWMASNSASCDMAIVGGVHQQRLPAVLKELESLAVPTICVAENFELQLLRSEFARVLAIRQHDAWLDSVVLLGSEILRRVEATARAKRAESSANASISHATLGKYMLDTRHGFNNALTSVLGNAELLLLEPAELPERMREQIDTIHNMALRLHEMMQRFSSLESEMYFSERESQSETKGAAQAYLSGT